MEWHVGPGELGEEKRQGIFSLFFTALRVQFMYINKFSVSQCGDKMTDITILTLEIRSEILSTFFITHFQGCVQS